MSNRISRTLASPALTAAPSLRTTRRVRQVVAADLPADACGGAGQDIGAVAVVGGEATETALPVVEQLPEPVSGSFRADLVGEVEQAGGDQVAVVGRTQRGPDDLVAAEPDQQVGDLAGGGDGATAAGLGLEHLVLGWPTVSVSSLPGKTSLAVSGGLVGVPGVEGQPLPAEAATSGAAFGWYVGLRLSAARRGR